MKTIKEVIEETTALAAKLKAENPGLTDLTFQFEGYSLEEMNEYADQTYSSHPEYREAFRRFSMCIIPAPTSWLCIFIRSVEVKAKLVYEEVEVVCE